MSQWWSRQWKHNGGATDDVNITHQYLLVTCTHLHACWVQGWFVRLNLSNTSARFICDEFNTLQDLTRKLCQGKSYDSRMLSFQVYKSSRQSNKMFTKCICGSMTRCRTVLWEVTFVCVAPLCAQAKSWCFLFWWSPLALAHLYAAASDQQNALYHKQHAWLNINAAFGLSAGSTA